jgi:hypothetical protein
VNIRACGKTGFWEPVNFRMARDPAEAGKIGKRWATRADLLRRTPFSPMYEMPTFCPMGGNWYTLLRPSFDSAPATSPMALSELSLQPQSSPRSRQPTLCLRLYASGFMPQAQARPGHGPGMMYTLHQSNSPAHSESRPSIKTGPNLLQRP